jgi:hypothetical protein
MIVVIVLMLVPTGARLILRARMNQMQFGSDDWVILIATVCYRRQMYIYAKDN